MQSRVEERILWLPFATLLAFFASLRYFFSSHFTALATKSMTSAWIIKPNL
jgi:hypothetical protein